MLPIAQSKWYLAGFLVPYEAPADHRADDDGDDQLDQIGRRIEADDDNTPEAASARKAFFPSWMGLSVLLKNAARAPGPHSGRPGRARRSANPPGPLSHKAYNVTYTPH